MRSKIQEFFLFSLLTAIVAIVAMSSNRDSRRVGFGLVKNGEILEPFLTLGVAKLEPEDDDENAKLGSWRFECRGELAVDDVSLRNDLLNIAGNITNVDVDADDDSGGR